MFALCSPCKIAATSLNQGLRSTRHVQTQGKLICVRCSLDRCLPFSFKLLTETLKYCCMAAYLHHVKALLCLKSHG